jgi:hypothetical protein
MTHQCIRADRNLLTHEVLLDPPGRGLEVERLDLTLAVREEDDRNSAAAARAAIAGLWLHVLSPASLEALDLEVDPEDLGDTPGAVACRVDRFRRHLFFGDVAHQVLELFDHIARIENFVLLG